jgi:uncharacterized protein (TIGR02001 family)
MAGNTFPVKRAWPALAACLGSAAWTMPAIAEDAGNAEAPASWEVEAELAVASDYRFRGVSLSNKRPAVQPGLSISHESGFYAGWWGSNIAENGGANIESDLQVGFSHEAGPLQIDVSANWYTYPGASANNYIELMGRASTPVAGGEVGLGYAFAPGQSGTGGRDNHYIALDSRFPIAGTALVVHDQIGLENGAFGDWKRDWSIGVAVELGNITLDLNYVDSARAGGDPSANAAVVATLTGTF